jgi:hypothetical protein
MALFSDGLVSCVQDLTAQDSQLDNVASVEGISATAKLQLAYEQLSMELTALLARNANAANYLTVSPSITLANIAVTPPLRLWHTARALDLFYGDAFFDQLNDRYSAKQTQFQALARWAYQKLLQIGLGIVNHPVPRAPAPALAPVPGALPDGVYYVAAAWVGANGQVGAASVPDTVATSSSTFTATPGAAPAAAAGWNVYVGFSADTMAQQNSAPLPVDAFWTQPLGLISSATAPGVGQPPDYYMPFAQNLQRG